MSKDVYLRPVREADMPAIHRWWNDPENFGATGLEHGISFEQAVSRFNARPSATPYEEWFAICRVGREEPIGIAIVAPHHPEQGLLSIGSLIVARAFRRQGVGRRAVESLEEWAQEHYPGLTLSLGVFRRFPGAVRFWEACGFRIVRQVVTNYEFEGQRQMALKFEKEIPSVLERGLDRG
jgi:RimJ/RimL family protein N-acetyltransferase